MFVLYFLVKLYSKIFFAITNNKKTNLTGRLELDLKFLFLIDRCYVSPSEVIKSFDSSCSDSSISLVRMPGLSVSSLVS